MCVGSKVVFCKSVGDSFKVCNDAEIIVFTEHRVGNEEPQAFAPPCWGYSIIYKTEDLLLKVILEIKSVSAEILQTAASVVTFLLRQTRFQANRLQGNGSKL